MRDRLTIFLVSVSLIGFQLAIINLLSYSQWHHFAYLAVSIAMLGFGSSGVIVSLKPKFFVQIAENQMPMLLILCGLLISLAPIAINSDWARFDTFLLFSDSKQFIKLLITCLVLFFPFFIGATIIALYFMIRSSIIPQLYSWNMFGSAVGGVCLVLLSTWIFPMHLAASFGLIAIISGLIVCRNKFQFFISFLGLLTSLIVINYQNEIPFASQYKLINSSLLLPETRIVETIASPQGVVEFVESNSIRQAQGMSLNYLGVIPQVDIAFLNGEFYYTFQEKITDSTLYSQNLYALPYILSKPSKSLVLNPGSTYIPLQAVALGSNSVLVVEPVKAISKKLTEYDWESENIRINNFYPREFLQKTVKQWSFIQFPLVGSFGGSSGISAIQEQYLFTTDALRMAMGKLTCEGIISLSTYMDSPPRYSLKIIALAIESLRSLEINPNTSFLAVRSWNNIMVLIKPIGFTELDLTITDCFCAENGFDMVFPKSKENNNILSDSTFSYIANNLLNSDAEEDTTEYLFNISPPSDNNPFFSQFLKISRFREYSNWLGGGVPFLELGYLIVWICLAVCVLIAFFAIAFPAIFKIRRGFVHLPLWLYFAFIGLAYMLIEISLIQKSILVVGNPITASAVIISILLCFSAIGSYYSNRFSFALNGRYILVGIGILILLIVFVSQNLFSHITNLPMWQRVMILSAIISPLAFLMGIPFPLAMKQITTKLPHQIPVLWGVNGFFSVIAAPIGTIVAVESGFNQVLVFSALFYLLCIPIAIIIGKKKI